MLIYDVLMDTYNYFIHHAIYNVKYNILSLLIFVYDSKNKYI